MYFQAEQQRNTHINILIKLIDMLTYEKDSFIFSVPRYTQLLLTAVASFYNQALSRVKINNSQQLTYNVYKVVAYFHNNSTNT